MDRANRDFVTLKTHPYGRHVPIALHMEVTTPGEVIFFSSKNPKIFSFSLPSLVDLSEVSSIQNFSDNNTSH